LGIGPNPQSPIPNPQSPSPKIAFKNCCQIIKLNDKINILVFVKKNKLKI